jgi:hypothetical protein
MGKIVRLRRALADLGFALTVIRRVDGVLVAEDVDAGGLTPLAVVWDDDPDVVRRRIRQGIAATDDHEAARLTRGAIAKAG